MAKRMPSFTKRTVTAAPASAVGMGSIGYAAGGPVWLDDFRSKRPPTPPELVNAYKAVAYACVQLNVKGVARVPLRLYAVTHPGERRPGRGLMRISRPVDARRRRYLQQVAPGLGRWIDVLLNGDVAVEEVHEHPYLEALDRPNTFFDGNLFLMYLAACLDVVGSTYFVPVRPDPTWASNEWWPLQAQYVYPLKGTPGEVCRGYQFFGQELAFDDVVRIRLLSLRDPYLSGFAPLHACFEQIGLVNSYTATVESILKNGARPSAQFVPSKPELAPGEPERKRFEHDVNNKFAGGRQGYIMVTNGAYTWQPFSYPPADLAGLEITRNQRLTVANCFDVPISLLQTEDSNRAVAEAGNYQHRRNAVEPPVRGDRQRPVAHGPPGGPAALLLLRQPGRGRP